jgi:hypothetical protein
MPEFQMKGYGEGRARLNVAYADVERAAIAILKSERRPTVETVRTALGRGSNDTIGEALRRFWRDLGARAEGDPAALSRMPVDIAELADGMWQRALKLAGEASNNDDNAAHERLKQIQIENEVKATSFALREAEWDAATRERERALVDSREHLLLTLRALSREQASVQARDARIADLETLVEQYRRQITTLIAAAVVKNRAPARGKAVGPHRAPTKRATRGSPRIPRQSTRARHQDSKPAPKQLSRRSKARSLPSKKRR